MSKIKLDDSFSVPTDVTSKWTICESKEDSVVDGVHILGRAVGPFFVTDSESGNRRFYSKKLWENAISKNADRMKNSSMLGTVGHKQPIDDLAIAEGKVSHKVTKLWIDEDTGVGMGEILIFGSDSGRNLNSYLRGGVPIAVSSRAGGEFNGQTKTGAKIVDEDSYSLEGFDFVLNPGVKTAVPTLVENLQPTDLPLDNATTEDDMSTALLESLTADKVSLQARLDESINALAASNRDKTALQSDLETVRTASQTLQESLDATTTELNESKAKVTELQESLAAYQELGDAATINEAMTQSMELIGQYQELGTISQLTEALDSADNLINEYSEIGSPDEIEEIVEEHDIYEELGSPKYIQSRLQLLEKYESLGSLTEFGSLFESYESYLKLGTVDEISETLTAVDGMINKLDNENLASEVSDLSTQYSVAPAKIEEMLKKHGKSETVSILESLMTPSTSTRYDAPKKDKVNEDLSEEDQGSGFVTSLSNGGSRAERLLESLSR